MRSIDKGPAPEEVRTYLRSTPTASFKDLTQRCGGAMIRAFAQEQKGLCAFCCNRLNDPTLPERGRIAHVSPQSEGAVNPTAWDNLVLSCDSERLPNPSCDAAQGDRPLPVSPLTPHVETLFEYRFSGRLVGLNAQAQDAIRILNLDSPDEDDRDHRLRAARRVAITTAATLKSQMTPARWTKLLAGDYRPLPAFQPALAAVLPR